MKLGTGVPPQDSSTTYPAEVKWGEDSPWSYGVSFVTDPLDNKYQVGAENTVYTGPAHPSYLQLPVVPAR